MNKQGSPFFYRVKGQKLKLHLIFLTFLLLFTRGPRKEREWEASLCHVTTGSGFCIFQDTQTSLRLLSTVQMSS